MTAVHKSDGDHSDPQRDVDMINSPGEWPKWPLLPLKHRRRKLFADDTSLGFMLADDPTTVYVGLMFFLQDKGENLGDFPTEKYASVDALVNDWQVD